MEMMIYTNAQLRSVLNGLGHAHQDELADPTFPLLVNDRPLTNSPFVQAIQKFRLDCQLEVNELIPLINFR